MLFFGFLRECLGVEVGGTLTPSLACAGCPKLWETLVSGLGFRAPHKESKMHQARSPLQDFLKRYSQEQLYSVAFAAFESPRGFRTSLNDTGVDVYTSFSLENVLKFRSREMTGIKILMSWLHDQNQADGASDRFYDYVSEDAEGDELLLIS